MAVQVRVQNFQSIADASVSIDGLTVVTGANNSGKTAFMRAIRGVFTNAPPGPLVRHGCAHLSVALTFDDGTSVLWEKGWEKPGRKGKTINRYTVNGKQIATVGRGVPPEVESLGVREISAASDRVWPQIAQQFDGTLFLVNRPGSAVAEALSDVERVGALSSALKASEKDRRSANAELKVRRKDVEGHKTGCLKGSMGWIVLGTRCVHWGLFVRGFRSKSNALDRSPDCKPVWRPPPTPPRLWKALILGQSRRQRLLRSSKPSRRSLAMPSGCKRRERRATGWQASQRSLSPRAQGRLRSRGSMQRRQASVLAFCKHGIR